MQSIFFSADFLMLCSIIELYNADLNRYFWIEVKILEITNHSNWENSAEKAMSLHSSTLAWIIPWMEEPGRVLPMVLLRVRHDWASSLSLFTFLHWRRKWKPIIGDLFREGVVISTPALNRQILLDLKAVKQEQGLRVNLYPWCHGPTH